MVWLYVSCLKEVEQFISYLSVIFYATVILPLRGECPTQAFQYTSGHALW